MKRHICIHGHFYQPPRENPWLEEVELQDSAQPYHDWNQRITAECYAPNSASRILDAEGRIVDIVNNYSKISFNFGPTLLSWLEKHHPGTYAKILEADAESMKRFSGHGSALAQPYNHIIMPLANRQDKETQMIWGLRDFVHRFKRRPEGMWLPETAVDLETLDLMAEMGIRFTILAPHQARRVRGPGKSDWQDVSEARIDPKTPYFCTLPSGRTMNLFFYDGPISREIAFGGLLNNGEIFASRLFKVFGKDAKDDQLMHIATDGETYGHHHANGDMALAYCLHHIESNNLANLTIYGEYLEKHPPNREVEIFERSSWSCVHGIERWRSDCGCNSGGNPGWNQAWRSPLRYGLDWLRDSLSGIFESSLSQHLATPWQARNDYIDFVLDRSHENLNGFFAKYQIEELAPGQRIKVLKLLEMQRYAMLMFTSCGWFFDEISGIETIQDMRYAARAIQLAKEVSGLDFEEAFLKIMEKAHSNNTIYLNGREAFEDQVKPMVLDLLRVGAHFAISSLFRGYPEKFRIYCYSAQSAKYEQLEMGWQKMAMGQTRIISDITQESTIVTFAVLHLGEHNFIGGGRYCAGEAGWTEAHEAIKGAFMKGDISSVIGLIDQHFDSHDFGLWHLFRDEQRSVVTQILDKTLQEIENNLRRLYSDYYPLMLAMRNLAIPLPEILSTTVKYVLNKDLTAVFEEEPLDMDRLGKVLQEIRRWSAQIDTSTLGLLAGTRIKNLMNRMESAQGVKSLVLLRELETLFNGLEGLNLHLDLWQAQNIYFSLIHTVFKDMQRKAEQGKEEAAEWAAGFVRLGDYFKLRII